jgi:hypothetical protein
MVGIDVTDHQWHVLNEARQRIRENQGRDRTDEIEKFNETLRSFLSNESNGIHSLLYSPFELICRRARLF